MVLPDVTMPVAIRRLTMKSVELKVVFAGLLPSGCVKPHLERFAAELMSDGYAALVPDQA